MKWKPIEALPPESEKGNVSYLLLCPFENWMCLGRTAYITVQASWFEGWLYPDALDGCIDWDDRIIGATHWMPLPEPPQK
jgi:hypothetical protein